MAFWTCRCVGRNHGADEAELETLPRFIFSADAGGQPAAYGSTAFGKWMGLAIAGLGIVGGSWRRVCAQVGVQQGCDVNSIPTDKIAVTQNANVR